ncbi:MAG: GNAT family N-acetyltransferase [Planctomycetota bacterium]
MASYDLRFRPFRATDAPRLERWLQGAGMPLPESLPRQVWAQRIAGGDARIQALTAMAGRVAIGFLRLDLAPDRSAELTLIVDPRHRRRGIGRLLVEKALEEARRLGLRRLSALVRPDNEPALRLFTETGFEPSATRVVGFECLARVVHRADRERPLEIVP